MSDNPCSSPKNHSEQKREEGSGEESSIWDSHAFFLLVALVSAWITFYAAYSVNVFSTPYLEQFMGLMLFTCWIWESVVVSLIVTGLAAVSFFFGAKVSVRNYVVLAALCSLEFVMVFWFFVAFFGV